MTDPTQADSPLVSVVVVTLDNLDLLRKCLTSLQAQDHPNVEIIVVDNGSREPVLAALEKEFPDVRGLRLESNAGFAGGNNHGIMHAKGTYVALLNNDAVAEPAWLSTLVSLAESDPGIGAVASLVIDGNDPRVLDSCGVGVAADGMSRQCRHGEPVPALDDPHEVLCVSGCACLFRKAALDQVGLFDEQFFAYCEDTDLCLRLRRAAWKIMAEPAARVTHHYSRTSGAHSLKKVFWVERNHYWVAIKNFPAPALVALPAVSLWRFMLQACLLAARKGGLDRFVGGHPFRTAGTLVSATLSMLRRVPAMWRKRRAFRPEVRLSDREFGRLLVRYRLSMRQVLTGTTDTAREDAP